MNDQRQYMRGLRQFVRLPAGRRGPRHRGCLPRPRCARSAADRCRRRGRWPGRSSDDGGIEELPLFRDSSPSSHSTRPCSYQINVACSAITVTDGAGTAILPGWGQIGHK
jgi:hypothetical protein